MKTFMLNKSRPLLILFCCGNIHVYNIKLAMLALAGVA